MSVRRECCNYCMWYGPANKDGGIRKHRPATRDDKWGRPNKVQDMSADPCPGSNKPYARFGTESEAIENAQIADKESTVLATKTTCTSHQSVADQRGSHTGELPVPHCESGITYGVWDDLDGGFTHAVDCAMEAANWAAEVLDEDPDNEFIIKAVCRSHEDQPAASCTICLA